MALPLMASTFAWFSRLIPAIPMAESRAPIVVGARHTNRATSVVIEVGFAIPACFAEKTEYVYSDIVTMINTMERATRKI